MLRPEQGVAACRNVTKERATHGRRLDALKIER
jgi:hypothetical protein